jgi:hypothetical protein
MKKVNLFPLLLVAQEPRGGGTVTCAPSSSSLLFPLSVTITPRGLSSASYTTVVMPYMIQRFLLCYEWTLLWYVYDTMALMAISDLSGISVLTHNKRCVGTVYSNLAVPRPCFYTKDVGRLRRGSKASTTRVLLARGHSCCLYDIIILCIVKAVRLSCI